MKYIFAESSSPRESFLTKKGKIYDFIEKNDNDTLKAEKILKLMTQQEKLEMLSGYERFAIKPIPRLGLDAMWMADATSGVRNVGKSTVFPCNVSMAATWDREKIKKASVTIAKECRAKGISLLLAPGVNIHRVPTCGRNFEYMGEDPYLTGEMASSYIQGVQECGVVACIKYFALNNSEADRTRTSSNISERALREIYLYPFKKAVKTADVKSVMTSYNLINRISAGENKNLITDILKNEWGFKGFVMSAWFSLYSTLDSIKAGLDLEMPISYRYRAKKIEKLLKKGKIVQGDIDDKVGRILRTFFSIGAYERDIVNSSFLEFGGVHRDIAREIAGDGTVLLKNRDNLLPLTSDKIKTLAVLGPMSILTEVGGGGSSKAVCYEFTSIFEAIVKQAPEDIAVKYIDSENMELLNYADAIVVCVGFSSVYETEMADREWSLPKKQIKLIKKCCKINKNVIVVLNSGSSVETKSWISDIATFVDIFYPGQVGGVALADIIFGKVNPSGKLPFSFPENYEDISATKNYVKKPGKFNICRFLGTGGIKLLRRIKNMNYDEGIFVGYRDLDRQNKRAVFPFGFGLSYSKFIISNLVVSSKILKRGKQLKVNVDVKNISQIRGGEVVQLYISDLKSSVERAVKELKGFEKIFLDPDEIRTLEFFIDEDDLAFYSEELKKFYAESGEFEILIGNSSEDIKLKQNFKLE